MISTAVLNALRSLDTPTVCNALEAVAPKRRGRGYTVDPLVCAKPGLPPIVGFARTARIRAQHPSSIDPKQTRRTSVGYYEYLATGEGPTITVIQDLDDNARGYGAFWGEVNSNIHRGLGCLGVITDGSIRDLGDIAENFQLLAGRIGPSHAHVHVVDYGAPVTVAGMAVREGDLIHADQHGAVVIPAEVADLIKAAADLIAKRERVIIDAAKQPDFSIDKLKAAWGEAAEIH